jgi:beta-phosphoglucomutase-like phosphatase (HAD superfamily)
LGLTGEFDFIATADDVEHSKPDPEIYELISRELDVPPDQCLVIEDSLPGVKAALAAGMSCIAVTTPFTRKAVDEAGVPDTKWIVDDAAKLEDVFHQMIEERSRQPSGAEAR